MPVFKVFLKIAKKNLPSGILYFVIFTMVGMVVSSANSTNKEFKMSSYTIGIRDNDNSQISNALIEYLDITHTIVEIPESKDDLIDKLYFRQINYTITIPEGFNESIVSNNDLLLTHEEIDNSAISYYINRQVQQFLNSVSAYMVSGKDETEAITYTNKALESGNQVEISNQKSNYDKSYFYFQFMAYVLICINFSVIAPVILVFNNKNIHSRNECSVVSTIKLRLQIVLGSIVISIGTWGLSLLTGIIAGGGINDNFLLCTINSIIMLIISVALVVLLTSFDIDKKATVMATNVIGLGLSFLGGIFVPLQFLGDRIIAISRFLPTYWYMKALDEIYFGSDMNKVYIAFGIQLLFAIAIFFVALMISKLNRQKRLV